MAERLWLNECLQCQKQEQTGNLWGVQTLCFLIKLSTDYVNETEETYVSGYFSVLVLLWWASGSAVYNRKSALLINVRALVLIINKRRSKYDEWRDRGQIYLTSLQPICCRSSCRSVSDVRGRMFFSSSSLLLGLFPSLMASVSRRRILLAREPTKTKIQQTLSSTRFLTQAKHLLMQYGKNRKWETGIGLWRNVLSIVRWQQETCTVTSVSKRQHVFPVWLSTCLYLCFAKNSFVEKFSKC